MLFRTLMMLSGDGAKGTLRLSRENGAVKAAVSVTGLPENGDYGIYIFFDEEKSMKIGRLRNGEFQGTVSLRQDARACGITKESNGLETLVMTGETGDFDWTRAKSMLYMKAKPQPKQENMPPAEPNEAPEEIFEEVYVPRPEDVAPYTGDMLDAYYNRVAGQESLTKALDEENAEDTAVPELTPAGTEEEELLARAREVFEQTREISCENCPLTIRKTPVRPFSKQYLDYVWEKTEYPGLQGYWHYITGKHYENGVLKRIAIGVPGEYAMNPPNWLYGFNTYVYAEDGDVKGYWLLFEEA